MPQLGSIAFAILLALTGASLSQSGDATQHSAPAPQKPAQATAPTIKKVTPPSAAPGKPLTISGLNFGNADAKNILTFNGQPVAAKPWTAKELTAVVPANTSASVLVIVVTVDGVKSNEYKYTLKPQSACSSEPVELQFLASTDTQELASLLNTIFGDVKVTADSGFSSDGKSAATICVKDRVTGNELPECDRTKDPHSSGAPCAVQDVVNELDVEAFKGGKLSSNFIVHLPDPPAQVAAADKTPSQPDPIAKTLAEDFSHATANFDVRKAARGYFLLIPSPGAPEQATRSGESLSAEAGLVKRDLELLDELYLNALSDTTLRTALVKDTRSDCFANPPANPEKAQIEAEQWLARHTVRLSILKPRDAALALQGLPGWTFQVRSFGQAISILPSELSAPRSNGAYLAADEVERDVIYHQKLDEDRAAASAKTSQTNGKSSNSSPTTSTTTTESTTTLETSSSGKPTVPVLTTKVTTTTGPAPKPPANSASGAQTPQESPTTDSTGTADSTNTDAAQAQKSGGSSDTKSAGNSKNPASGDTKSAGETPAATSTSPSQQTLRLDNVVRLFHLRQADKIAEAINKAAPSADKPLVQAVDDNGNNDLILILPSPPGGPDQTTSVRRAIAMFDLPRPQLSLQVWSYQMSGEINAKNPHDLAGSASDMQQASIELRDAVNEANDSMTKALAAGFGTLLDRAAKKKDAPFFNETVRGYLTQRMSECLPKDSYCLGFYDALDVPSGDGASMDASLSRLLLFLIAANDEQAVTVVPEIICAMNQAGISGGKCPPTKAPQAKQVKESDSSADQLDESSSRCHRKPPPDLRFDHFGTELELLAKRRNLHIFQAALLDFLFQYKWTVIYPDDFVPYDLQRTAHQLDSLLGPIVDALNQDLDGYVIAKLDEVGDKFNCQPQYGKIGLISRGNVQVASLSGSKASVDGKVNNYFDITPPLSLNDILNVGNQSNVASNLKNVLEPKEILALQALANIGNQSRITAQVTKEAKLTITPSTLDTASSALLDVDFDVSEPNPPQTVNQKDSQKDLLDRVAEHHVVTHVRVESLKLFQLSSFSMELTHPLRGTPVPVVGWAWEGIFGATPGMGRLFRMPPYSKTVDNRSYAIVRAVVVPTAMDWGLSLRFESDRIKDPITDATDPLNSMKQAGGKLRPFHKCFVQHIVNPQAVCPSSLSTTPEDLRDPTTP